MCKSLLYAVNAISQVGPNVNFGDVVRRIGSNIQLSGGNPVIVGAGYYKIDSKFVVTLADAGTATITLLEDGVPIPGANATFTVAAGTYTVSIPAVVREVCCEKNTITATVSTGTIVNASILIEKV